MAIARDSGFGPVSCVFEVLLLSWQDNLKFDHDYHLLEVFAGSAQVSKKWWLGYCPVTAAPFEETSRLSRGQH